MTDQFKIHPSLIPLGQAAEAARTKGRGSRGPEEREYSAAIKAIDNECERLRMSKEYSISLGALKLLGEAVCALDECSPASRELVERAHAAIAAALGKDEALLYGDE